MVRFVMHHKSLAGSGELPARDVRARKNSDISETDASEASSDISEIQLDLLMGELALPGDEGSGPSFSRDGIDAALRANAVEGRLLPRPALRERGREPSFSSTPKIVHRLSRVSEAPPSEAPTSEAPPSSSFDTVEVYGRAPPKVPAAALTLVPRLPTRQLGAEPSFGSEESFRGSDRSSRHDDLGDERLLTLDQFLSGEDKGDD